MSYWFFFINRLAMYFPFFLRKTLSFLADLWNEIFFLLAYDTYMILPSLDNDISLLLLWLRNMWLIMWVYNLLEHRYLSILKFSPHSFAEKNNENRMYMIILICFFCKDRAADVCISFWNDSIIHECVEEKSRFSWLSRDLIDLFPV